MIDAPKNQTVSVRLKAPRSHYDITIGTGTLRRIGSETRLGCSPLIILIID